MACFLLLDGSTNTQQNKKKGSQFQQHMDLGFNASHGSELLRNGVVGPHHSITPGLVL